MAFATSGNPDSLYVQDCRTVQSSTHSIQTLTGQISKMVAKLQSTSDYEQCRHKVDEAVQLAKDTKTMLIGRCRNHKRAAQDPVEKNNRIMMYRKLSDNLSVTVRVLEDVVRRYQREDKKRPAAPALVSVSAFGDPHATASEADSLLDLEQPSPPLAGPLEFNIADEQEETRKGVEEDLSSLQKIYTELAAAVQESQSTVESMETHMASATADEHGRLEMQAMPLPPAEKLQERRYAIGAAFGALLLLVCYTTS